MRSSKRFRTDTILLTGILLAIILSMLALGMIAFLLFTLGQVQFGTARMLDQMGEGLNSFLGEDVEYTVQVDQNIPINLDFPVNQELTVPLRVQINQEFPLILDIPVETQIVVPIETTIPIKQTFNATVNLLGQPVAIPIEIEGDIPVDMTVDVPFEETISIDTTIPISMPVTAEFAVAISQTVPIETDFPLNMEVPIQLSLGNETMDKFMLGIELTAQEMEASGQRMIVVVWVLAGVLVITLVLVGVILSQYRISRNETGE